MAKRLGVTLGQGWISPVEKVKCLEIDDDAYASFIFFTRHSDQWRYSTTGTLIGLDMPAMLGLIALEKRKRGARKRLLADVMAVVSGVKDGIAERDDAEA